MGWEASNLAFNVLLVLKVLHRSVGAGKQLGYMAILPAHDVGRRAVVTSDLEDLAISVRFAHVMSLDYQAITWTCLEHWFAR